MLQARFLDLKADYINTGLKQTEICDPTVEALERLFTENGFHVHTYVANLMIVLLRRSVLGLENVGEENALKVVELYPEVSKTYYLKDFKLFASVFKHVLLPGTSICDYIYLKMIQYLGFHHRFRGDKQKGILMMAKYLKMRLQFKMYTKLENLLAEILLLAIQALECGTYMFKQARHLISVVYEHFKRMEALLGTVHDSTNMILLKEFALMTETLYIATILQVSKDNWDVMRSNKKLENKYFIFSMEYEKFKDEVTEVKLPLKVLENLEDVHKLYQRMNGYKFEIFQLANIMVEMLRAVQFLYPFLTED